MELIDNSYIKSIEINKVIFKGGGESKKALRYECGNLELLITYNNESKYDVAVDLGLHKSMESYTFKIHEFKQVDNKFLVTIECKVLLSKVKYGYLKKVVYFVMNVNGKKK